MFAIFPTPESVIETISIDDNNDKNILSFSGGTKGYILDFKNNKINRMIHLSSSIEKSEIKIKDTQTGESDYDILT